MNKFVLGLNPVLAALALGACSTAPTMPDKAWKVEPVQSVRHSGSNAAGYYALGRYNEGKGAHHDAVAAYRKALDADPGHAAAWNALGALQAKRGRFDEALPALERAVKLSPGASHAHNNLGYALLLAGRDEAALASLQRAVELDGGNRYAWANLAAAYRRLGMQDKAELAGLRAQGSVATDRNAQTAPAVPAAAGEAATAAPAPAATVHPVSTDLPAQTPLPAIAPSRAAAAADHPIGAHQPPAAANPATRPALKVDTTPRTTVVKLADNVYALRTTPATTAGRIAEAAAIVAAARPAAAPAAMLADARSDDGAASAIAPAAGSAPAASRAVRHEIANGHGGTGLARRLAALLGKQGIARPRLTNQRPFDQPASFVEYRDGYREVAESFAARLPFRPTIRPAASAALSADVRLVLGRDLDTSDACGVLGLCPRIARAEPPALAAAQAPLHGR